MYLVFTFESLVWQAGEELSKIVTFLYYLGKCIPNQDTDVGFVRLSN